MNCVAAWMPARSDVPNFNDPNKPGEGQAMVERITNLIGIFSTVFGPAIRRRCTE